MTKPKTYSVSLDSRIAQYALKQCGIQHRSLRNWVNMAILEYIKAQHNIPEQPNSTTQQDAPNDSQAMQSILDDWQGYHTSF